jgi:hypothetical protein
MIRRTARTLLFLTPLALGACLLATPATGADPRAKGDTAKAAAEIKRTGKLAGAHYWKLAEARHPGKKRTVEAKPFLKAKGKAGPGTTALAAGTKSSLIVVGADGVPEGFGKGFTWDRAENEALLVMFINAADPLGVSIDGLQAGDEVQVLSASGIASFSEDKGNPLASSIVGLVAAGANVAVSVAGAPEVAPVITAAETFAKDQFKATNAKTKRRDTFGVDPGSGHKAREEGGILVCLPEAGGTFYSGDGDHKERWIQGDGVRSDEHLPAHLYGSFFPRQGFASHNTRMARQSGQMYIVPWDWKFEDNAGYYKVFVKLKKGNGLPPETIPLRKTTTPTATAKTKAKQ